MKSLFLLSLISFSALAQDTVLIKRPRIKTQESSYRISAYSKPNSVCRALGYHRAESFEVKSLGELGPFMAVPAIMYHSARQTKLVLLSEQGELVDFLPFAENEEQSLHYESITCFR